ncbi:MAG: 1-acyl-sn-glycerol-3-phosphate acyltransferase [Synergistaceae bacterium]|nr:1-acyl-sn-glycerol-3-phosphate acyltransferase [Synergistaceae bacterium]
MKQSKLFYVIVKNFFKIILIIYNRCTSRWLEKLSPNEKFIVACNHASNLDPLIIGCFFPRNLRYLAKEELFTNRIFGACLKALGAMPVSRQSNASAAGALKAFLKLYQEGNDVLIFPEGGRTLDGNLQPLEAGVGLIAAHEHAPILPAFIHGSFKAMPPGSAFVKPTKLRVTFGKPLRFSEEVYKSKEGRKVIMDALEKAMRELEAGE